MALLLNPSKAFFYLLAYIAVLYLRPQEFIPGLLDLPIVPVMICLTGGFWLFQQRKDFDAPHHVLLPCLLVAMAISLVFAGWAGGALIVVNDFIPTMVLFYVIATSIDSLERFRATGLALTAIAVILALHGAEQAASPEGVGWTGAKLIDGRITYVGILNDPNDLSMALLIALPFSLYLANTTTSLLARLASLASAATIMYGVFLCNSRGAVLGLLAMMMAASVRRFGWMRSLAVVPVLVGGLLVLGPDRAGDLSADEESAAGRIDAWYEGFGMFREHPVFGVGKGLFTEHNRLTAHNSYVLAMSELGIVGYFVWLSFFVLAGIMLYRLTHSSEPGAQPAADGPPDADADAPQWQDIQRAARTLGYAFIGAMTTAFFLSRSYIVFLYLLVGLVVGLYQLAREHWPDFEAVRFGDWWGRLLLIEIASIAGLWALTQVLLRLN